jgi:SlyX protein
MRDGGGDSVEGRFVDLETKLAFQEKTIADLNEVVIDQGRTLAELVRRVKTLEAQLRSFLDDADPTLERPPHY